MDKFYIKTFGCQMNVADSERMSALLSEQGMEETARVEDAAVIILNGCTVREKAVHKALSQLGVYNKDLKKSAKPPIIGMGGCVGQLEKETLFQNAPYLDFVFGTDTIDNLPEIVYRVRNGERHVVYADFDKTADYSTETKVVGAKAQAYVNIMKGCDKYCTYCIVPFTRGKEKSRTIDEVLDDVARLVAGGVREVTLLGQNVNSFGKGNTNSANREPRELSNPIGKVGPRDGEENFPQLLRAMEHDPRLAKLKIIRFTSSHPLDFSDELIDCYAPSGPGAVTKLAANLHLPVQSGSDAVLQKMGRHHKIDQYIEQMARLKAMRPDVSLSTDLIVGFPTETEEDFEKTIQLLDRVQYDNIYAFAYSPRPGTRAAKLPDDVPDSVKNSRLNRLLAHQLEISAKLYRAHVGSQMEILIEGESRNQNMIERARAEALAQVEDRPGGDRPVVSGAMDAAAVTVTGDSSQTETAPAQSRVLKHLDGHRVWTGRTSCNRIVNFVSDSPRSMIGRFALVEIVGATSLSLQGKLVALQ